MNHSSWLYWGMFRIYKCLDWWSKNDIFEHTCAYARWAHMHRFLSVCDWTKIQTGQKSLDQNSYLGNRLSYGHQIWYGDEH